MVALLSDPLFIFAVSVFIFVMVYFASQDRKEKEKQLEERIKKIEELQKKANQDN